MRNSIGFAGAALALTVTLAGCHVNEQKTGDNKDVKIETPFGGMQVKTNDAVARSDIGLPVYPGAVPVKKDNGDDNTAADVNMSFGNFQLKVKAASYRTNDAPNKVEAFYRDRLKRYGDVIACRGDHTVGSPDHTPEGLTCSGKHGAHVNLNVDSDSKLELKAGSRQHQHIVAIEPNGSGTKIGMVALDLPGKLSSNDAGGDRE